MWRTLRMAASALAISLVLSGFALASDGDRYYGARNGSQAEQYGYQNGYRDGINRGREEGREHDRYDGRSVDWRHASRGYQSWMGPIDLYRSAYQDGYRNGFDDGYRSASRGWNDWDRDRYYRPGSYDPSPYGRGFGSRQAFDYGYQDGFNVAREDIAKRKPYNPEPRGKYDDRDHGYRREYGDKNAYRATYSDGYRRGYEAIMHRRY